MPFFRSVLKAALTAIFTLPVQPAGPLSLEVYNPGDAAIFPVSSVIVSGEREAVLIDAQFGRSQAAKVVERIKAGGKNLTTIYISHGDPDFYFGLETLKGAFPEARILATAQTVEYIKKSAAGKLAFWGPKLGDDAPKRTYVPEVLSGNRIVLEDQVLLVAGLEGPQPERSFVWIPSLKALVGGVVVFGNLHVWMADTQSPSSHQYWLETLKNIEALAPSTVVPGHFAPGTPHSLTAVQFTGGYIRAFDEETAKAKDGEALIAAMKQRYPNLGQLASLEISAKVAKGEMKWPALADDAISGQ